jgi:uncharacterized protein (TIGR04255 family)
VSVQLRKEVVVDKLGKLKNAPVYFALVQVKHNPVPLLDVYAQSIKDEMRKAGYPDQEQSVALSFSFVTSEQPDQQPTAKQEQIQRLMFFNLSKTKGFIVEPSAITFYTTDYDVSKTFFSDFLSGVSIVHNCVKLDYIERIGLRYLDAVVPPKGFGQLAEFLTPTVLGLTDVQGDIKVSHSISETHFSADDCNVLARTIIINNKGPIGFPMDIQLNGVTLDEKFASVNSEHAILDTDASIEGRRVFDASLLSDELKKLKNGTRKAFGLLVTNEAIAFWNT